MKNQVIEVLRGSASKPKEKFQKLFDLYRAHPQANQTLARHFNATGFTGDNLSSLEYEIKKLYEIAEIMLKGKPKTQEAPKKEKRGLSITDLQGIKSPEEVLELAKKHSLPISGVVEPLPEFSKGLEGNRERLAWLKEKGIEHNFKTKKDLEGLIEKTQYTLLKNAAYEIVQDLLKKQSSKAGETIIMAIKESPEVVKEGVKLREQYPFLNDKDCPDVLKIAVADKITAYHSYIETREDLKKAAATQNLSNEEIFEIAKKAVEEFTLNRDLYKELEYYKEHGELLAQAPGFEEEALKETVENYSTIELVKRRKNLKIYIGREAKVLESMEESPEKQELQNKVTSWEKELNLVEERLEKIS